MLWIQKGHDGWVELGKVESQWEGMSYEFDTKKIEKMDCLKASCFVRDLKIIMFAGREGA